VSRIVNSARAASALPSSCASGENPNLARQQPLALNDAPRSTEPSTPSTTAPPRSAILNQEVRIHAKRAGHILLVDDEDWCRETFQILLTELGYTVDSAASAEDALKKFDPLQYQLVLTDNRMPGMSGVELAEEIKQRSPATPILMCTALAPQGPLVADAVLEKPVPLQLLKNALERLTCLDNRNAAVQR
jgi:CheY-like chemotaxis protein